MNGLNDAFSPERFRDSGHAAIDQWANHLAAAQQRRVPVLPWVEPVEMLKRWPAEFPGGDTFEQLSSRLVADSIHLHHPRYVGHQVTPPLPDAALADALSALLNNGSSVYEMGPAATAMEINLVRWMGGRLGFPSSCGGALTSGGSLGNFTALLAARQARAGFDCWKLGQQSGPPLAVLCSDQTHYCVQRAVRMMGWGDDGAVSIPTDSRYKMRADLLESALAQSRSLGRRVIGVVASASSTSTGAIDPLEEIAEFCRRHDLWFHVDGAHGASLAISQKHRFRLKGIERADSVVWDPHKLMLMPALITGIIYRDANHAYGAFAQEASYLFGGADPRDEWFNTGVRTLECTKLIMGFKLYSSLRIHGEGMFASYVEAMLERATQFAALLRETGDFRVAVEPECNIVCFRYEPQGQEMTDAKQSEIRERVIRRGGFYLVKTRLRDGVYLRTTLLNPMVTLEDLKALLEEIRLVGGSLTR